MNNFEYPVHFRYQPATALKDLKYSLVRIVSPFIIVVKRSEMKNLNYFNKHFLLSDSFSFFTTSATRTNQNFKSTEQNFLEELSRKHTLRSYFVNYGDVIVNIPSIYKTTMNLITISQSEPPKIFCFTHCLQHHFQFSDFVGYLLQL